MISFPIISILTFPYRFIKRRYFSMRMKKFGLSSWIEKPLRIQGIENISIGEGVGIHHRTWLAALPLTGNHTAQLIINDNCVIGDYNHIFATQSIIIEKSVLTANHVYISDNIHDYKDIETPVRNQSVIQQSEVIIGEGSWLGENVCIIGASIGKHCVIGANSVVTKNIPDYSVAVGIPARVIRKYDNNLNQWIKC